MSNYDYDVKEHYIRDYLLKQEFDGEINIKKMKEDLKYVLSEEPAISVNRKREEFLNEANGETYNLEFLESIEFYYTTENVVEYNRLSVPTTTPQIKKLKIDLTDDIFNN